MRLLYATAALTVNGIARTGLPLLLTRSGQIVEIALFFLTHQLLHRGRISSQETWRTYGEALHHFFSFLEGANRRWDECRRLGSPSVLADYRTWCLEEKKSSRSTVSLRMNVISSMYQFAKLHNLIDELPWNLEPHGHARANHSLLGHLSNNQSGARRDTAISTRPSLPKCLSLIQIQSLVNALKSDEQRLIVRFMLQTGLRCCETRTLPASYITDTPQEVHSIALRSHEMVLKNNAEGVLYISDSLMTELWKYKISVRSNRSDSSNAELFISNRGSPYSRSFFTTLFSRVSTALGYRVNAHMLRHTYATHTLHSFRRTANDGAALMYLRDRLRHSSVRTTEIYLHVTSEAADKVVDAYQTQIDEIFS